MKFFLSIKILIVSNIIFFPLLLQSNCTAMSVSV